MSLGRQLSGHPLVIGFSILQHISESGLNISTCRTSGLLHPQVHEAPSTVNTWQAGTFLACSKGRQANSPMRILIANEHSAFFVPVCNTSPYVKTLSEQSASSPPSSGS